jgi:tetratricopeptide (TPR) repeat protein
LREERRATAHAGVKAREYVLHATQLDPNLADAYTGLGLYNYYVDTLSPIVKMMRFFMGIPGGSKKEGILQLERAMNQGELTSIEARFYLAKNLRTYDHQYERALTIATPLIEHYPRNPLFLLLVGNLFMELGRNEPAAAVFHAAQKLTVPDPACAARVEQLVQTLLSPLH